MQPDKIATAWVDPEFVSGFFAQSMAAQLRDMEYFECAGKVLRYTSAQQIDSRNMICKIFLEETDDEWLWFVDADMLFDQGHVMKLWETATEHGVKIVSGLAFIHREKAIPSAFYWGNDRELVSFFNYIPKEPRIVAATGMASMLIHRDVLEAMQPARTEHRRWFDMLTAEDIGVSNTTPMGMDTAFCVRAGNAGFPMMLNPDARTRHLEDAIIDYDTWVTDWGIE